MRDIRFIFTFQHWSCTHTERQIPLWAIMITYSNNCAPKVKKKKVRVDFATDEDILSYFPISNRAAAKLKWTVFLERKRVSVPVFLTSFRPMVMLPAIIHLVV